MKKNYLSTLLFAAIAPLFFACIGNIDNPSDTPGNTDNPSESDGVVSLSGSIKVEADNISDYLQGCKIVSLADETELQGTSFSVNANTNACLQTFILSGNNDEAYMIARIPVEKGKQVDISIQSTTLALVTLHPLFSPLHKDVYDEMKTLITSSPYYNPLYNEVEKLVKNKQDVLSESNADMILALSNLLEDLFKNVNEDLSEEVIPSVPSFVRSTGSITRGNYDNPNIYPLSASVYGNKLVLQNTNLTPSYYGYVEQADGTTQDLRVLTASDWGWWQWITQGQMRYGNQTEFSFNKEGEYRFKLSRVNEAATIDFYMRLGSCVLSTLGLDTAGDRTFGNFICNRCTSIIGSLSDLNGNATDIPTVLSVVSGAVCDYLQMEVSKDLINKGWWEKARTIGKYVGKALAIYNIIKGSSNILDRIAYAVAAPKELNFCLCYYNGEISTCTTAKLIKAGGDEQTGYAEQKLLLPLKVYVQTLGDDGLYHPSSSFHKVKFEVVSGGGRMTNELVAASDGNVASSEWYLGEAGEQKVKVTVVDIITDKEISDPVYFSAELRENADLTVRLDWNKLSGNTDIDLHVTDPYGEEIAFYHMNSASGGWLDRDDVVGPGPEHVSWSNAPSGAYLVQVHYYGSESQAITSYKVTINALGETYGPYTGSIAYHQLITIGVLNLPSGTFTRACSTDHSVPEFLERKEVKDNIVYPFKK